MMLIHNLPVDICQEILSWLEYDDRIMFVRANRTISKQLIKSARVLWLGGKNLDFKFKSYLTSEKLQSLITNPYHQMTVIVPENFDLKAVGFDEISIRCQSLSITAHQLARWFTRWIKNVQNLTLEFNSSPQQLLTYTEFQFISDWMNNLELGLKHLTIKNYNITTNLPVISRLQSLTISNTKLLNLNGLNISSYSYLHCLRLHSISIEDVSSLDGINELYLEYCDSIRDISCLNHNYKIVILECDKIIDYSNCFRYSKIIDISLPSKYPRDSIQSCDLSKAIEARQISFSGGNCTKPLLLPQCASLRSVRAEFLPGHLTLPCEHRIREIIVGYCEDFKSLLNFDCIYSVKLFNLNISTLEGLGSGNRLVEVDTCQSIRDFSILRDCEKVTIRNCEGFHYVDQVRGVKDIIFSPFDADNLPKDMEGVTSLILVKVPSNLLSLKFPTTLKALVIHSEIPGLLQQLPLLLASLSIHVKKIQVSVKEKTFRSLFAKGEIYFPNFIIEFQKGIQFLRKLS